MTAHLSVTLRVAEGCPLPRSGVPSGAMPYVYFASYARLDKTKFTKLASMLDELKDAVRARLGARSQ